MIALRGRAVVLAALGAGCFTGSAQAQTAPPLQFAAPADCATNPNCALGLRKVYGADVTPHLVKLSDPDAGIQALDDGLAEVAVAFSSNPELSRPDIVTLRDDRRMIGPDRVVPAVRRAVLKRYGPDLRRRLNAASRLLTTLALRGLNQQVIDGRLPEAVGGEFIDANGLGGTAKRRSGPRIVVGYQDFDENRTLAYLYAEALRAGGYRVVVRSVGGLRKEAVAALRSGRVSLYPAYSGSLREYLRAKTLRGALAKLGAEPLALSSAQNRNAFAMKGDRARALGISTLSDLARAWKTPTARAAASDPLQGEQWAVAADSVLDLPGAWRLTRGAGTVVAVVDSGTKLDHPDLAPNVWTNFAEIPGNHVDDDDNGYVDDVHGVDLTTTDARQDLGDGHGHGTHVAGIIAAAANGRGVVGVAPQVKIMTVKVLDASGAGTTGAVAEGIRYAAANGARVINASIQGDQPDPRLDEAVAAAGAANALVVVAAGNDARDIDSRPSYPAAIAAPNLIGVAATAPDDGRGLDTYSNYGRVTVGLAAPGGLILSTTNDGGYGEKSGTSMASPMVAGVAALMASVNPGISAVDLRALLLQHAARAALPVSAGYVDALDSVLASSTAVGGNVTRAPRLQILRATNRGKKTQLQVAVFGSTQAIRTYRVLLDGKRVAGLQARRPTFTLTVPRRGRRAEVLALDAGNRTLTKARRNVSRLRAGKGGVNSGRGVSS
jgi:glycine betaine/choline ABC-type transport system substrate-binding protein